jgi:hypothetical protein
MELFGSQPIYPLVGRGVPEPTMADADRLQMLAHACVQAALNIEDADTAAMVLESAQRFLARANTELALIRSDVSAFNRRQMYAGFEH